MTLDCRAFLPSHPLLLALILGSPAEQVLTTTPDRGLRSDGIAMVGEELVYEVRWTLFNLGIIRVHTISARESEAFIDSFDNLPFVNLHAVHYTLMDSNYCARLSRSIARTDGEWEGLICTPDSLNRRVIVENIKVKDPSTAPFHRTVQDTIPLQSPSYIDGLSILYFAQSLIHTNRVVSIPTILSGKLSTTTFEYNMTRTKQSIDACDYPVRVIEVKGVTTGEGVFGMSGDFVGWFTDDVAAVPVRGKLKVARWKRDGGADPLEAGQLDSPEIKMPSPDWKKAFTDTLCARRRYSTD